MNAVIVATVAGLSTAVMWGTSDWLSSKSAKNFSPIEVNFGLQVVATILACLLLFSGNVHVPNASQYLRIALGTSLITAAYLIFVKALTSGAVGVIVPIGNSFPLITLLLSTIFLGQVFTAWQLIAIVGILFGAIMLAYEKNHDNIPFRELHKETLLAVAAALIWGVAFFVINPVVSHISWESLTVMSELIALPLSFIILVAAYRTQTPAAVRRALNSRTNLLIGVVGEAGIIGLYVGSHASGSVIIPTVLSSASPLVASLIGAVVDHEKIGVFKRVGALVLVAGVILLNVA